MTKDSSGVIQRRFDDFQREAVAALEHDFRESPAGRFLLVIPTGGGKTFTAVKAINSLFEKGVLDPDEQIVIWVAHRKLLLHQAQETFVRFEELYPERASYKSRVRFEMIGNAPATYRDPSTCLVVIDEAHHAAARSYLPLFERAEVGVLGLTATPSRHDGLPLEFERESFSIGFPDLVEAGVVLHPEIVQENGGRYEIADLDESSLEVFDNATRNEQIVRALLKGGGRYQKIVVYVGTVGHVKSLYRSLCASELKRHYKEISWVTGSGTSRGPDREAFLAREKTLKRSIVVNVNVLAEGYDDPSVNTVVMAVPTRSKLVYMQCMGRAIRHNPEDESKKAYLVELVDDLPNVRYRIDNRWLFADVSDVLEPAVIDRWYDSESSFRTQVCDIFEEYRVPSKDREIPEYESRDRYSLLLFKRYTGDRTYQHYPVLLKNDNRQEVLRFFDYFSERILRLRGRGWGMPALESLAKGFHLESLTEQTSRRALLEAFLNSAEPQTESPNAAITNAAPWITYVALRYRRTAVPEELAEFLTEIVNREALEALVRERAYLPGSYLLKCPLPLSGYIGRVLTPKESVEIRRFIDGLTEIHDKNEPTEQRELVATYIDSRTFPLEQRYLQAMQTLVRESTDCWRELP